MPFGRKCNIREMVGNVTVLTTARAPLAGYGDDLVPGISTSKSSLGELSPALLR